MDYGGEHNWDVPQALLRDQEARNYAGCQARQEDVAHLVKSTRNARAAFVASTGARTFINFIREYAPLTASPGASAFGLSSETTTGVACLFGSATPTDVPLGLGIVSPAPRAKRREGSLATLVQQLRLITWLHRLEHSLATGV
ncbi:uncharacterized protein LOC142589780 [Dermacentor variabilis]|uniref:uncharacterized protein LOC142589780 n=1 Tax=Dermacentor variabilis TaxID=34621 RepID=UPI003F5B0DC9